MPLSPEAQRAALASQTALTPLQTLTFAHPQIETLRLVSDTQDLTNSNGVYSRFAFAVVPPEKNSDQTPRLQITIGMVDQRVMLALRQLRGIRGKITITYSEVQADAPDTLIYGPARFYFDDMKTDGATSAKITATFLKGALDNAYPAGRISPSNAA